MKRILKKNSIARLPILTRIISKRKLPDPPEPEPDPPNPKLKNLMKRSLIRNFFFGKWP